MRGKAGHWGADKYKLYLICSSMPHFFKDFSWRPLSSPGKQNGSYTLPLAFGSIPLEVSPVFVPYIDVYEFDGGDLAHFHKRLGVKRNNLSAYQHIGLAQAWLYFGFLKVFIGEKIDKGDLLRLPRALEVIHTRYVLDSSKLKDLLNRCVTRQRRQTSYGGQTRQERHWKQTLDIAQERIKAFQKDYERKDMEWDESCGAVLLSIHILETTLRNFYFRTNIYSARETASIAHLNAMNKRQRIYIRPSTQVSQQSISNISVVDESDERAGMVCASNWACTRKRGFRSRLLSFVLDQD